MADLNLEGMAIADGVVETIVSIALQDVEGISLVGAPGPAGILGSLAQAKPVPQGVEVTMGADNKLNVAVHTEAKYGYTLPDLAAKVRSAVSDAVLAQVGVEVASVDVYIDSVQF